ncbi:NAD(+)/NADH kinase [Desulfobacterales bacterium HSG17]|nr:NAD(+)/NADH kinase [Desulfobacterales bacterium HSG17]
MEKRKVKLNSVAIYCHHKPEKEKVESAFLRELLRFFHKQKVGNVRGDVRTVSMLKNSIPLIDDEESYDLKIGIGGDGTLLKMMRTLQKNDGLLLGVNFGTLGFLSELNPENAMSGIKKIFRGEFTVDERMLIKNFVWRDNERGRREKVFRSYGLNEMVFGHGGLARLTNFHVKVSRRVLTTYRSDGLIFSTPTGSTAYSLSAGGPIVYPGLKTILATPIAPHTLNHRPILLPADKIIHLSFDGRVDSISMTIDGQIHFSLKPTDEVSIQKATRTANFIRLKESHYFRTLRGKLGWGV